MALTAVECPGGVCHSHHGGHAVEREQLRENLAAHGPAWCERLAERVFEISVDSFSQTVMPHLHQDGWQRRHLDWEFKLQPAPAEAERTLVDGAINAVESFLRSTEVQRLFVQELVQGTLAEADQSGLRSRAVRQLIEQELLAHLQERRGELLERLAAAMPRIGAPTRALALAEADWDPDAAVGLLRQFQVANLERLDALQQRRKKLREGIEAAAAGGGGGLGGGGAGTGDGEEEQEGVSTVVAARKAEARRLRKGEEVEEMESAERRWRRQQRRQRQRQNVLPLKIRLPR